MKKPKWYEVPTLVRLLARLKSAPYGGNGLNPAGGTWGWSNSIPPGTSHDYAADARNAHANSAVYAAIDWVSTVLPEAPFCVMRGQGQDAAPIEDHPLTALVKHPNPYFSRSMLWSATLLSRMIDGNAYWLKVRGANKQIVELWWLPHWEVQPCWDGSDFITYYSYRVNGVWQRIDPADIVHFRHGVDPQNVRKGLSPLQAVLREVASDNEAATYSAAILRNMGVPGVVIAPKEDSAGAMMEESVAEIKRAYSARFVGDKRGEPLVLRLPMDVTAPGFSPENLALDKLRSVPEARICAVLKIPPMVLGLNVGDQQKTYANYAEARRAAYESCIIPTQEAMTEEMDNQLLPELGDPGTQYTQFDRTNVAALQEERNSLYQRAVGAFVGGVLLRSEARQQLGLEFDPARDDVYNADLKPVAGVVRGEAPTLPKALLNGHNHKAAEGSFTYTVEDVKRAYDHATPDMRALLAARTRDANSN